MSRVFEVLGALVLVALGAPGCSSDDPAIDGAVATSGGGSGGGSAPAAGSATGGTIAIAGAGPLAGAAGNGGLGTSGAAAAGGGTATSGGAGSVPVDCNAVPADPCPMPSGISFACKKRFALGVNYAWRNFGADFGGLAMWNIRGVAAASADYLADLNEMKAGGASLVRWWVFPDFRSDGVQFDASDDPTGVSPTALADIAKALELAEQADVYLVPTLFSFDGFRPKTTTEGVVVRSITGLVNTPARRAKLIANVVKPFAHAAATSGHAGRLIGWDIVNEPEWAIKPSGQNSQDFSPNEELEPVSLADMKALIGEAAVVLEQETPAAFTSVGWAAAKWAWAFNDVALDVNQPHIYAWVNQYWPYTLAADKLGYPARPTLMGEFFLLPMPFSEGSNNASIGAILESWWSHGYAGAWPWHHFEEAKNLPLLKAFADSKGCQAKF